MLASTTLGTTADEQRIDSPQGGPHVTSEGAIPEPPPETVAAAVEALLDAWPARRAALYLHAFAGQPDVRWAALARRLSAEPRVQLEDRPAH